MNTMLLLFIAKWRNSRTARGITHASIFLLSGLHYERVHQRVRFAPLAVTVLRCRVLKGFFFSVYRVTVELFKLIKRACFDEEFCVTA